MESSSMAPSKKEHNPLISKKDEPPFSQLTRDQIWQGVKLIANATFSTSASFLCVYTINMISLAFISNLKNAAMIGGIGLGFVCSNCCAYILITSINQGVNALAAQAYGAKRYSFVALNYHRGLFLQLILLLPILVLLGFTKAILTSVGIDETVAQYALEYIQYAFPSVLFYGIFDATKSYLFAQKIFLPVLKIQFTAMLVHIFWAWLFIGKFEMGPAGAGLAKNCFEFFNMIAIMVYINRSNCCADTWVPFKNIDWKNVVESEGIKRFLSFTIPIAAILLIDMLCYEIFSILAGQFDENQLAVHVAVANSSTIYYGLPLGLSIAIMTYVSHAMGAGQINAAKNLTYFGVIVDLAITIVFVIFVFLCRNQWAEIFSANDEIKSLLLSVLDIYLLVIFFDGVQVALSGTVKGIGKQNTATIAMIIIYYILTLPLIYWLSFSLDMQVRGIWFGFLIGIITLFGIFLIILKKANWYAQAKMLSLNFASSDVEMGPMH